MKRTTVFTVSEAYQDATDGNDSEISVHSEMFKTKGGALKRLRAFVRERIEQHYEGNDDWTDRDTDAEVSETFNRAEIRCGNMHLKWINDYEHLAWSLQGHNI